MKVWIQNIKLKLVIPITPTCGIDRNKSGFRSSYSKLNSLKNDFNVARLSMLANEVGRLCHCCLRFVRVVIIVMHFCIFRGVDDAFVVMMSNG